MAGGQAGGGGIGRFNGFMKEGALGAEEGALVSAGAGGAMVATDAGGISSAGVAGTGF